MGCTVRDVPDPALKGYELRRVLVFGQIGKRDGQLTKKRLWEPSVSNLVRQEFYNVLGDGARYSVLGGVRARVIGLRLTTKRGCIQR